MARLYFRIYLAVIGSILLFALLAAVAWRFRPDEGRFGPRPELLAAIAEQIAPPAQLPATEQRRMLEAGATGRASILRSSPPTAVSSRPPTTSA